MKNSHAFSRLIRALGLITLLACGARADAAPLSRDPLDRLMLRERMRVQILHKTHDVPPARYRDLVAPQLRLQLAQLGFRPDEVQDILTRVDETRARGPW